MLQIRALWLGMPDMGDVEAKTGRLLGSCAGENNGSPANNERGFLV